MLTPSFQQIKLVSAKGRGYTDIIFAKCIICSLAQLTILEAHFLCLNLSKAFDTPSRGLTLHSLKQASGGDQDISHTLWSGTTLRIQLTNKKAFPLIQEWLFCKGTVSALLPSPPHLSLQSIIHIVYIDDL